LVNIETLKFRYIFALKIAVVVGLRASAPTYTFLFNT